MQVLLIIGSLAAAIWLIRVWTGAMNIAAIEQEPLSSIEHRHPYLPKLSAILVSVLIAGVLLFLSLKYGKTTSLSSFRGSTALLRSALVFGLIALFGIFDQVRWRGEKDRYKYFYAFILGTLVTWVLIAFKRGLFEAGIDDDPFLTALGITCLVVGWRFLFGPWSAPIKATVLGTFIFWVAYAILRFETRAELTATAIAALAALIPVIIWCWLFLAQHRQRLGVVTLAFFAGMMSTVPILFYSEITRRGMELNFFFFKIVPLSYGSTSKQFVTQSLQGLSPLNSIVVTTLVTYLLVGVIEEYCKYWVLRYSSRDFFRSIDDAMQLAIIVAIGFAFAENLVNPTYFTGFVKDYLLTPARPEWGHFTSSVVGRSVLTNMVHILSTGVLGYFVGLAFFASPLLKDQFARGRSRPLFMLVHQMLSLRTESVYSRTQLLTGLLAAFVLHGLFDFIVSLPDVLPGNPASVGALLGSSSGFLGGISLIIVPAVLYTVGGLWLLMVLFEKKEDMKEFGAIIETQTFVTSDSGG